MADNNTYYECDCVYHRHGYILCDKCAEWHDKVDKTIEEHRVDEVTRITRTTSVTKTKRWNKQKAKK